MKHILTTSSARTCKQCPYKYYLRYVLGLRRDREATPLRFGTNWHLGLERLGEGVPIDGVCGEVAANYSTRPEYMDPTAWEVEYYTVASSLVAYREHYKNDGLAVLATERSFCLPIRNPATGHPSTKWRRSGKIDKRVQVGDVAAIMEHKTTADDISPGSEYWKQLRLDSQVSMYLSAEREEGRDTYTVLYDVFRKPQIKPKKLSQADTLSFVTTKKYFGQQFDVACHHDEAKKLVGISVNGAPTEMETLKSGNPVIREIPAMFGARLLSDMTREPAKYFARCEIARTDDDLDSAASELWAIMQQINVMGKTGHFYRNEYECLRFGRCDYCNICFEGIDPSDETPEGYVCVENVHPELEETQDDHSSTAVCAADGAA